MDRGQGRITVSDRTRLFVLSSYLVALASFFTIQEISKKEKEILVNDTIASQVLACLRTLSAPHGIRAITPGRIARQLHRDPCEIRSVMTRLADQGLLTLHRQILCPACSSFLDRSLPPLGESVRCETCLETFVVSADNIAVSFAYDPKKDPDRVQQPPAH